MEEPKDNTEVPKTFNSNRLIKQLSIIVGVVLLYGVVFPYIKQEFEPSEAITSAIDGLFFIFLLGIIVYIANLFFNLVSDGDGDRRYWSFP